MPEDVPFISARLMPIHTVTVDQKNVDAQADRQLFSYKIADNHRYLVQYMGKYLKGKSFGKLLANDAQFYL